MDSRAVIDKYRRLLVNRSLYRSIMGSDVMTNPMNELLQVDDALQVMVIDNSNLLCLDVEGDIDLINQRYQQGRKAQLPSHIGRIIYITVWNEKTPILTFVNEAKHIYHIEVNKIIADINSNREVNIPEIVTPFGVISIYSSYKLNNIRWIDDHGYLNYVEVIIDKNTRHIRIETTSIEHPISPMPVRLRHGYMIDENNHIFALGDRLQYSYVFSQDRTTIIADICSTPHSSNIKILNDEGLMETYFDDGEYSHTTEGVVVDKFVELKYYGICLVRDNGNIVGMNSGVTIRLPKNLYIVDELSHYTDNIKSGEMYIGIR